MKLQHLFLSLAIGIGSIAVPNALAAKDIVTESGQDKTEKNLKIFEKSDLKIRWHNLNDAEQNTVLPLGFKIYVSKSKENLQKQILQKVDEEIEEFAAMAPDDVNRFSGWHFQFFNYWRNDVRMFGNNMLGNADVDKMMQKINRSEKDTVMAAIAKAETLIKDGYAADAISIWMGLESVDQNEGPAETIKLAADAVAKLTTPIHVQLTKRQFLLIEGLIERNIIKAIDGNTINHTLDEWLTLKPYTPYAHFKSLFVYVRDMNPADAEVLKKEAEVVLDKVDSWLMTQYRAALQKDSPDLKDWVMCVSGAVERVGYQPLGLEYGDFRKVEGRFYQGYERPSFPASFCALE